MPGNPVLSLMEIQWNKIDFFFNCNKCKSCIYLPPNQSNLSLIFFMPYSTAGAAYPHVCSKQKQQQAQQTENAR